MTEEKKDGNKRHIILILLYIFSLLLFLISGAFTISVIFNSKESDSINKNVQVGEVSMKLENTKDTNIKLIDSYPMSDDEAKKLEPLEFTITNTGTLPLIYRLRAEDVNNDETLSEYKNLERLNHQNIRFSLIDKSNNQTIKTGLLSGLENGIIIEEKILPRYDKTFEYRLWVDKDAGNDAQNKIYIGRIVLEVSEILE